MGVIIALFVLAIIIVAITTIANVNEKYKNLEHVKEEKGAKGALEARHCTGLPVLENVPCIIYAYPDKMEIDINGVNYNLNVDQITNMSVMTEEEIQKHVTSSAGGAVAGAMLLGPLGALIGGRTKTKKTKEVTNYLIVTYLKDDAVKYLTFEIDYAFAGRAFIGNFNLPQTNKPIQL